MSGSRPTPAEQHLGDRLAALVDGELGHESRDRVLAHLATCPKCKAEADAQRRLKNVFAEAAPPPPSESFLARLQELPGGGDGDGGDMPLGGGGAAGFPGTFGPRRDRFAFDYVPARPHGSMLPGSPADRGFRIHDVSRHETDRSASRGMRLAFVAAGAVSLAAIALGGVTSAGPGGLTADARGGGGSNVTPARPQGTGTATTPENQRRRGVGLPAVQELGERALSDTPAAPTEVSAPLLPGMPPAALRSEQAVRTVTAPVMTGAAAMSPLIRPLGTTPPLTLTSWSASPGPLAVPSVEASSVPSPSPSVSAR